MNKKQLIVSWVMGILLCLIILFPPKRYILYGKEYNRQEILNYYNSTPNPVVVKDKLKWDFVIQRSLIALIIGGLLIYTLRDKKK